MELHLDYSSADFNALSRENRIIKCRQMAEEATRLAANGSDKREDYLSLAARWTALADEMESSGFLPLSEQARRVG